MSTSTFTLFPFRSTLWIIDQQKVLSPKLVRGTFLSENGVTRNEIFARNILGLSKYYG